MPLSLTDEAFVQEYVKTRNGTEAYVRTHPRCKSRHGARVEATRVLAKASVKQAVREALQLTDLQATLRWCMDEAQRTKDLKETRGAVMDYAKLAGLIVDKQEVKALNDHEIETLRVIALQVVQQQVPKVTEPPLSDIPDSSACDSVRCEGDRTPGSDASRA